MPKHNFVDLTGQTFGRLLVLSRSVDNEQGKPMWACQCSCGQTKDVRGIDIRRGTATSCGCYRKELARTPRLPDGFRSARHRMYTWVKDRARRRGILFDLTTDDIVIPDRCPVLGLVLSPNVGHAAPNSPSLDRIDPSKGYVRENVQVLSQRANIIKKDATLNDILSLIEYMRNHTISAAPVEIRIHGIEGDLTGRRFGWVIVEKHCKRDSWVCKCDCGVMIIFPRSVLAFRRSCGSCIRNTKSQSPQQGESGKSGKRGTTRYVLWHAARGRSLKFGMPFDLTLDDIRIPDVCPVLGIQLDRNIGGLGALPGSPSLDRVIPSKGYIRGNVRVISTRANVLKGDSTLDELLMMASFIQKGQ